jgi:outer membrane biosynthesis protein TonB
MNSRFSRYLGIVTIGHFVALGVLISFPIWFRVFHRKTETVIPNVEFVVAVPPSMAAHDQSTDLGLDITPKSKPKPKPASKPKPDDKGDKKAESKPDDGKKSGVKVSDKIIVRHPPSSGVPQKLLSEEKIKELLAQGATPGTYNSIPEGDALYFEVIKRTYYKAWNEPGYEEVHDAVAEVSIKFLTDGTIASATMTKKTGIAIMDQSVLQAVNSLKRIDGLSPDFVKYHNPVTVSFKVTAE